MGDKRIFSNGTFSRMGLVLALSAVFLLGMVGIAGAQTVPVTNKAGVINVTYQIHNDSDSGYSAGYWGLDNYTQTLTLTPVPSTTPQQYDVSAVLNGTTCTFAGDLSPHAGTPQQYSGCVSLTGSWSGILTTDGTFSIPSTFPAVTNVGGNKLGLGGASNVPVASSQAAATNGWETLFGEPVSDFSGASTYSFTYTAPGDGTWVDSSSVSEASSGDIIIAGPTVTAIETVEPAPVPVCALGINSGAITFPALYGGETIAPSTNQEVLVTNESTFVPDVGGASAGVTVEGTEWSGLTAVDTMPVGQTTVLLGATSAGDTNLYTSPFALSGTPSGTVVDLAPSGGAAWLTFGLSVPSGQAPDTYTQTITVAPTC